VNTERDERAPSRNILLEHLSSEYAEDIAHFARLYLIERRGMERGGYALDADERRRCDVAESFIATFEKGAGMSVNHGASTTVQFSLVNGGWTVICPTCRTWLGPYMAQDYAEKVARFDHDHPSQKGDPLTDSDESLPDPDPQTDAKRGSSPH
jgi:hypothetical protein